MKRRISAVLVLLGAIACGPLKTETSDPSSVVYNQNKWPNPTAIPVCIINRSEVSDELFNDVKSHVITDYANKVGIGFTGWGNCTSADMSARKIRVHFSRIHNWNSGRVTAGGGLSVVGSSSYACGTRCAGGTLRIDISADGRYPATTAWSRNFAVTQTRATAVHEFGHALGLLHEHERTDAPGCGDYEDKVRNTDRTVYVGNYDANSIMNYCHNSSLTKLSAGDVAGLKYLYPQLGGGNSGNVTPPATPTPRPAPDNVASFGPFGHNETKVLMTFPSSQGRYVNFSVTVDTEPHPQCEYDHVIVEDAAGWRSSRFCGRTAWKLSNLQTPARIIFYSDPAVASKSVTVTKVSYSGAGAAASPAADAEAPADQE